MGFAASIAPAWVPLPGDPASAAPVRCMSLIAAGVPGLEFLAAD